MRLKIVFSILLLLPLTVHADTAALEQLLHKASARGGSFTFTQISTASDGSTATAAGTLAFMQPDRFTIAYARPDQITIVSNGSKLWVHDELLNQVVISDIAVNKQAKVLVAVLAAKEIAPDLSKSVVQEGGTSWLVLKPENPENYDFLECALSFTAAGDIAQAKFTNLLGTEVIAQLNLVASGNLTAQDFEFVIPDGAEVIQESN